MYRITLKNPISIDNVATTYIIDVESYVGADAVNPNVVEFKIAGRKGIVNVSNVLGIVELPKDKPVPPTPPEDREIKEGVVPRKPSLNMP